MNKASAHEEQTPLQALIRRARLAFVMVGVFSFALNLMMLITPLYMFQVFDRVLTSGRTETLLFLTLIAVLATVLYGIIESTRAFLLGRIGHWMERDFTGQSITKGLSHPGLSSLPLREYLQVQNFVSGQGIAPFFDAPWVPVFLVVLFLLHPLIGVFSACSALVIGLLAFLNERLTREPLETAQRMQGSVTAELAGAARNAEVISALNMAPAIAGRLQVPLDAAQDQLLTASDRAGTLLGFTKGFRLAVQIGVMALGAYLVLTGDLSPGGMIAGSILLGRALAPVEQALGAWRAFVGARESYNRLNDLFQAGDGSATPRTRLPEPHGHLVATNITYAPPGQDTPILKRISLEVRPGQVLGIIGPSAAGKSQLCRVLIGTAKAQNGEVRIDGSEIDHWDKAQLADCLGYLPQGVELFAGTVRDNIARMGAGTDEMVIAAAKEAGAHDMILGLPEGYETRLGVDGAGLSAGQRQRIGLARALFGDPKLIILDEPNSALDEDGERALLAGIISAKRRGAAIILVAHRRTVLQVVDTLLLMRDGAVEAFGPRDKVLSQLQTARAEAGGATP